MRIGYKSTRNLLWILCNSAVVNCVQAACYVFLRPFHSALYRHVMSMLQTLLLDVFAMCLPVSHLKITGDLPSNPHRPAIILANHQVDADWWYLWQIIQRQNAAGNVKIVLKGQLKKVPILGWGMRFFEFLFLNRRFEQDAPNIKKYMKSLINDEYPYWLVLFPEGTTIHTEGVVKSEAFAKAHNRPSMNHVMLPRTAGLQVIMDAIAADQKPDIYDFTIAYPSYSGEIPTDNMGYTRERDEDVPSMKTLLAGTDPGVVSMHVRKYSFDEVYGDVQGFLDRCWKQKDADMEYFIKHQDFPAKRDELQRTITRDGSVKSVVYLWIGVAIVTALVPVVTLGFFPAYTIWVIFCMIRAICDRTITQWLPYILDLFIINASFARDMLKKRGHSGAEA